ncbi:MAG: cell division protein FtsQ/DivIB [Desulfovibrio sp.]
MSPNLGPSYLNSGSRALKQRSNRYRGSRSSGLSGSSSPLLRRGMLLLGGFVFLTALMAGLFFGYRWVTTTDAFALEEIRVECNERLSYGDVLLAGKVRLGQNCLGLNVGRVEALLAKNPWVANVSVRRELPGRLVVNLTERKPAYWVRRGGTLYYADENGDLIAAVSPADFQSLPVLDVDAAEQQHVGELPEMLEALQRGGLPLSSSALAWVRLSGAGQVDMFLDDANLTLSFTARDWRSELRLVRAAAMDIRRRGEMDGVRRITASGGKVWVEKTH